MRRGAATGLGEIGVPDFEGRLGSDFFGLWGFGGGGFDFDADFFWLVGLVDLVFEGFGFGFEVGLEFLEFGEPGFEGGFAFGGGGGAEFAFAFAVEVAEGMDGFVVALFVEGGDLGGLLAGGGVGVFLDFDVAGEGVAVPGANGLTAHDEVVAAGLEAGEGEGFVGEFVTAVGEFVAEGGVVADDPGESGGEEVEGEGLGRGAGGGGEGGTAGGGFPGFAGDDGVDAADGAGFAEGFDDGVGHDVLAGGVGVDGVGDEGEVGVGLAALGGEIVEGAPEVDVAVVALAGGFAKPGGVVGEDGVVTGDVAAFGVFGFFEDAFVPGLVVEHGGAHEEDAAAEGVEFVEEGGDVLFVGVEGGLVEVLVGGVVHAEEDGGDSGFEAGDVVVEAVKDVGGAVAGDAGVTEVDAAAGEAGVVEVFDVLGVEALVGDGVADEDEAVAVFEVETGRCGGWFGGGSGWGSLGCGGGDEAGGEEGKEAIHGDRSDRIFAG
jgi:hypothetical protein